MIEPVESMEPSKLDRRLCIRCVTSVTQDRVYISKDTSFPKHLFIGGRVYSFKNIGQDI